MFPDSPSSEDLKLPPTPSLFGDVPLPMFPDASQTNIEAALLEIERQQRTIIHDVHSVLRIVKANTLTLDNLVSRVTALAVSVDDIIRPLIDTTQTLIERERDRDIFFPLVNGIALIISRCEAEISTTEKAIDPFFVIEDCRSLDRQELLDLLNLFGIEQFSVRPGSKFDPATSTVTHVRPTDDIRRHGRVLKLLTPGYRRASDNWVIRPARVEVLGPPKQ